MEEELLKSIATYLNSYFGTRPFFACVYGSFASHNQHRRSDLDIFIAIKQPTLQDKQQLVNFILEQHHLHGLIIDNEVPYENKLVVSYEDLCNAIGLKAFPIEGDSYKIPKILKTEEYLSSKEMRWRLLLNALSTPHLHIAGSADTYSYFRKRVEGSVYRLGYELARKTPVLISSHAVIKSLLMGENGVTGELYLGYKAEKPQVLEYLTNVINRRHNNS